MATIQVKSDSKSFTYRFYSNLRERKQEAGIRVVIASDINEANQILKASGCTVLDNLSLSARQHSGWYCLRDAGVPIQQAGGGIVLSLPSHS